MARKKITYTKEQQAASSELAGLLNRALELARAAGCDKFRVAMRTGAGNLFDYSYNRKDDPNPPPYAESDEGSANGEAKRFLGVRPSAVVR